MNIPTYVSDRMTEISLMMTTGKSEKALRDKCRYEVKRLKKLKPFTGKERKGLIKQFDTIARSDDPYGIVREILRLWGEKLKEI